MTKLTCTSHFPISLPLVLPRSISGSTVLLACILVYSMFPVPPSLPAASLENFLILLFSLLLSLLFLCSSSSKNKKRGRGQWWVERERVTEEWEEKEV